MTEGSFGFPLPFAIFPWRPAFAVAAQELLLFRRARLPSPAGIRARHWRTAAAGARPWPGRAQRPWQGGGHLAPGRGLRIWRPDRPPSHRRPARPAPVARAGRLRRPLRPFFLHPAWDCTYLPILRWADLRTRAVHALASSLIRVRSELGPNAASVPRRYHSVPNPRTRTGNSRRIAIGCDSLNTSRVAHQSSKNQIRPGRWEECI